MVYGRWRSRVEPSFIYAVCLPRQTIPVLFAGLSPEKDVASLAVIVGVVLPVETRGPLERVSLMAFSGDNWFVEVQVFRGNKPRLMRAGTSKSDVSLLRMPEKADLILFPTVSGK